MLEYYMNSFGIFIVYKYNGKLIDYISTYKRQLIVVLKKNFKLQVNQTECSIQIRYWRTTLTQILFAPLGYLILLFILQRAGHIRDSRSIPNPYSYPLDAIPTCQGYKENEPCINLMFTPKNAQTLAIMNKLSDNNAARGKERFTVEDNDLNVLDKPTKKIGAVAVPDSDFIYTYTFNNPNTTMFGISFDFTQNSLVTTNTISYQVWYNYSLHNNGSDVYSRPLLSLFRGLDEAILSYYNDPSGNANPVKLDVTIKDWPLVPPRLLFDDLVNSYGPAFFFAAAMMIFNNILNTVVTEKELGLRYAMETMGLKSSVYWLSTFISYFYLVIIASLVICVFGILFRFSYFTNAAFSVIFVQFSLFGTAMVCLAMFITVFCRRAKIAVLFGVFLFIIGLIFQNFVFSNSFVGYVWWDVSVDPAAWKTLCTLIPFFNFGKIFLDVGLLTAGRKDALTETFIPGVTWDTIYQKMDSTYLPDYGSGAPDVPTIAVSFQFLILNIFIYGILTWYFDHVYPDEYGQRQPFYFFLLPSHWGYKSEKKIQKDDPKLKDPKFSDEDEDVRNERDLVYKEENSNSEKFPLRIVNLIKEYKKYPFLKSKTDKIAVNKTCLALEQGKLLAFLGQNGAGKSTTMNILSGLTPPTDGDAFIYGKSCKHEMENIRKILGVCPQHDILFNDLTAKEHIQLYGAIKGVSDEEIKKIIEERLEAVKLTKVADRFSSTYSGGMKRRLSMIISTIGDPKVILMDEPTTGMDPVNRRHVWSFIEKFKENRIIVLTTHSMEEADVLGDRIAIMAHGRLRAIGNSMRLKSRFGDGYRISMNVHPSDTEKTKEQVAKYFQKARLEDDTAGSILYQLSPEATTVIPDFVQFLESDLPEAKLVKAWGISQTTLEEVFLSIIRKANPQGYNGYEVK
ncbi:hypothetical protein ROZALSC1DRAFT_26676 [Rozella allomycis CSF55]|uniref:ABC-2 family transporter protein domain-containing protein n=1 Tax=Rozella allomycis (strain CSF55) TaxID=988480 RepID=A0A075B0M7_ROZAC|nr:ABC-2 family transporter protein domain-containing protein [Rozella allomycis CSF55]RKP21936.1 hypothetical protein ROZALSC1DRAFT_26676 [Rozella allomycis CSF55]|eukprot:EPZ35947.1 ABC-2 family transporter protein domain-containing protein [Rozella allomycis CSF55]